MQVDYQHNKTEIKAFNLEDGSLLWETDQLDLNGKNGLQMVSVLNGETLWTQKEFKGGIGELLYEDKTDRLLAITVPATDGALDLLTTTPEVIALEANSGELLWKADYRRFYAELCHHRQQHLGASLFQTRLYRPATRHRTPWRCT